MKKISTDNLEDKGPEAKLDWYRGKILSGTISIERALGWRLRKYFFSKPTVQAAIFYEIILNTNFFTFERKISLYQRIPYFTKLKGYSKTIDSLRFVQKIRNELAHWELWSEAADGREVVIYDPITVKMRRLDKKLIEEFESHAKRLLKSFGWYFTLEAKYGIKNRNLFSKRNIQLGEMVRMIKKLK